MSAVLPLDDAYARRQALLDHDSSLIVEAGAGSGKTALMAGRVVMLLAAGQAPSSIAAVTFTELAASELVQRVRDFVQLLCEGSVPSELRLALPDGPDAEQATRLGAALARIDEITCSTIHGFCQRLIMPYPVEAGIDPGASVMSAVQADMLYGDLLEQWLREELDQAQGGSLAEFLDCGIRPMLALVRTLAARLRHYRQDVVLPEADTAVPLQTWRTSFASLAGFIERCGIIEDKSQAVLQEGRQFDLAVSAVPAAILTLQLPNAMFTKQGTARALRNKGVWTKAAREVGIATSEAEALLLELEGYVAASAEALLQLRAAASAAILAGLARAIQPVLARYQQAKRNAALLDFDDLIFAARALVRDHEPVRQALAQRYRHVLVDEFQDTDALQAEIFWTLCGELAATGAQDWRLRDIRPGALFLVGDPKQAIYRFRGADIAVYMAAREAFYRRDPKSVLAITTNFRSVQPILTFVNQCFAAALSADGQPGFVALNAFRGDCQESAVVGLDIQIGDGNVAQIRQAEADAVADFCQRLIGQYRLRDKQGEEYPCRAADIALLAPSSAELWRYEAALEARGIAVVSQAGKGFYRQQEVQDLVALVRVLADARDTLALGALLRGPLVGLTEEALLDIVWHLQQTTPGAALSLWTDTALIDNELARQVLGDLKQLYLLSSSTTPALLLAEAIERLRVRHILVLRHAGRAERALANVQQFLEKANEYAVLGLAAFADDVSRDWADEVSVREGVRDKQEDAVTLFTMHASKGLEWPIVIPVNGCTQWMASDADFVQRNGGKLRCKVLGVAPPGYEEAIQNENADLACERVRLWYVAMTRARQLLVLPRGFDRPAETWAGVLALDLESLPTLALSDQDEPALITSDTPVTQCAEQFSQECVVIETVQREIRWGSPSRGEGAGELIPVEDGDARIDAGYASVAGVRGSRERGRVIHKLLEEVINGETVNDEGTLVARATELIEALGLFPCLDPSEGMSPEEIARCVAATLTLPEVSPLLSTLQAEYPLWSCTPDKQTEHVMTGVADAVSIDSNGRVHTIIDWKSDVIPGPSLLEQYRAQVAAYVKMAGAVRGLLVMVSSGQVIEV
ncbi:UvrD-helicase domain-containing protein [Pseudoduganella sp. FT93W]|uniref:DNA 3'-5' helicase n=1 Tax=Duganella fentianensis TaxID=2692177 RepID=A0A845I292_9BURK|nr:UvrD-helicase domain-containing protein [Duganella fentianensis]MYN45905.1 UvrD-helicase domain-containing protein [Duganella fentianensis]